MREHVFSGLNVYATGRLDKDGIPYIAYDNNKGDTPVKAEQLPDTLAYVVTYEPDDIQLPQPNQKEKKDA